MSWYNPLSWGQSDPEKYDPNTQAEREARTFSIAGRNGNYDINSEGINGYETNNTVANQAQGSQLDQTQANQSRGNQQGLANTLNAAMQGQGPSAADFAAQGQQRSALANAAALNAGNRGRDAVGGAIVGNAQASQGVQQAAQNQMLGKMQEMAQARGEYGNLASNMRSQDLGAAGQNAQLAQNNAQYNTGLRQNTDQYNASNIQQRNLANQNASLNIGNAELAARQHQGDMAFTNLDPGAKGYFGDIMAGLGNTAGSAGGNLKSMSPMAHGGVVSGQGLPRYGGGVAVGGTSPSYQLMGIGQRRTPISKGDLDQGRMLAQGIINFMGAFTAADAGGGAAPMANQAPADPGTASSAPGSAYSQGPMTSPNAGPVTSPSQVDSSLMAAPSAAGASSAPITSAAPSAATMAGEGGSAASAAQAANAALFLARGGVVSGHQGPSPAPVTMAKGGAVNLITKLAPLAMMLLEHGGAVDPGCEAPDSEDGPIAGPQKAIVGEAGPEAIIDIRGVVDRPTVTTLGSHGRAQAVIPLSKGREGDRKRVLRDIVAMLGGDK